MAASDPVVVAVRIALVILGFVLVWLGRKGVLEPLLMIPMGLGMATINVSSMFFDPINMANKTPRGPYRDQQPVSRLDDQQQRSPDDAHADRLAAPVYTLTFSNGLIAWPDLHRHRFAA